MCSRLISSLFALTTLTACSIHPLPEDVTGVTTPDIVKQIRCETREALRSTIITWLRSIGETGSTDAQALAAKYEQHPEAISGFRGDIEKTPGFARVLRVVDLFYDAAIAYNFDLTMTETNKVGAKLDLLNPMTLAKLTASLKGDVEKSRTNQREFTLTDTFSYLLTKLNEAERQGQRYCDGRIVGPNYTYPIAGRIGVDSLIRDFVNMTLFENLGPSKERPLTPTMSDKLSFTTKLDFSLTPTWVFTPATQALHVASFGLTPSTGRTDLHKVTVALAIDAAGAKYLDATRRDIFAGDRAKTAGGSSRSVLVGNRVIGGGSRSELLAIQVIDQIKSREVQLIAPQ